VRARFAQGHLVSHARVDGWQPSFILGYQEFLFIGPGFTWATVAVHWLSLGLLSLDGAFKLVVIGSFVALPLTVAFLARSIGLDRWAAALAAILILAVNSPFGGVGLQGLFNVGLVTHQFGALFFFLSLGSAIRLLREPTRRWVVLTAVSMAGLLMSHGISVMVFAVVLALALLILVSATQLRNPSVGDFHRAVRHEVRAELLRLGVLGDDEPGPPPEPSGDGPGRILARGVVRLALATAIAFALAACVLLPFAAHRDLRGTVTGWGTPALGLRLAQIWRGQILFRPGVAALILAGFVYAAVRAARGEAKALLLFVLPIGFVVIAHAALHEWPSSVVTLQLPNRGLGYAGALAVLPLAFLLARSSRPFGLAGRLAAVLAAAAIVVVPLGPTRNLAKQMGDPIPQLPAAASELARVVPDGARFVTQRDFPGEIERTHLVNPDRWLAWASGRNTLNNFNVESSQNPDPAYQSEQIGKRQPEAVADALAPLGVTHLVTVSDPTADRIATSPRFTLVWRESPLAIFAVSAPTGQPSPSSLLATEQPARARLVSAGAEHVTIRVDASTATRATVAIGWSPKWHAHLAGGPTLHLRKDPRGLLETSLPAGPSVLTLDFRSDVWDHLGVAVSLVTLVAGIAYLLNRREGTRWARFIRKSRSGGAQGRR
jgi:hypothetical protein